ncbi:hypothetical protein B4Q13_20245 [Lacticaseibacillus rhamnosus]
MHQLRSDGLRLVLRDVGEDALEEADQQGGVERRVLLAERALFVIDKEGVIAWSYNSPVAVNPGAVRLFDAETGQAIREASV